MLSVIYRRYILTYYKVTPPIASQSASWLGRARPYRLTIMTNKKNAPTNNGLHKNMLLLASISFSFFVLSKCESRFSDVNMEQGLVRGFNVDDDEVFSFYGIPYATAPTGEDRFKVKHIFLLYSPFCVFLTFLFYNSRKSLYSCFLDNLFVLDMAVSKTFNFNRNHYHHLHGPRHSMQL